ncbi:MAG: hypothetical protein IJ594_04285 [Oscillospiraceae bacterium]|nr:hypothetical protein [Oscillospiraceae bacterium]
MASETVNKTVYNPWRELSKEDHARIKQRLSKKSTVERIEEQFPGWSKDVDPDVIAKLHKIDQERSTT